MNSKYLLNLIISFLVFVLPVGLFGEKLVNDTRSTIDQWVETRQIISKESSQLEIEKVLLENPRTDFRSCPTRF